MATHFFFPRDLHAIEEEHEDGRLCAQNPVVVTSLRPSELEEFVKAVSFDLSDKEVFCIEEQDVFDRVYSLVRNFSDLSTPCKLNIVESLRSNLSVLLPNIDSLSRARNPEGLDHPVLDRITSHRNAFKIYIFFLLNIVLSEDRNASCTNTSKVLASARKKQPKNSWNWEAQRARIVNIIANALEINLVVLFGSSDLDENFLSFVVKCAFSMCENASVLKDADTKDGLCRIIGTCATKYHYTTQSCASVLHLIHKYDFVTSPMAEAVDRAQKKYADGSLGTSLIREIARTNPKDYVKDTVGAENIGHFLVELANRLPKLVSSNLGLLIPHFGGESYKIRNALVGVLGKLVLKAFNDNEGEVSSKSLRIRAKHAMLDILLERCRDVSAYTRNRVLQIWAELCEEHAVPIGLWKEVSVIAAGKLEDRSAIVRKAALNLIIMMLQCNPFGPQLCIASFEATLKQYKSKLNELERDAPSKNVLDEETSNRDYEIVHKNANIDMQASLPDSFFPDAEDVDSQKDNIVPDMGNLEQTRALVASLEAGLSFSKCVSSTMPTLVQLMASTSVTDVENTILLLMRCKQFQIDGSEACLRKMLPLVFSQDKSIHEAVENAFITIYITKNSVETAKNILSLAIDPNIGDFAALESLVGLLVSKGDISTTTINALWDFFCFNVSGTTAEQSRSALSVICMAAKACPAILSSHVQELLDIGFGRWAKKENLLARTACIALQRLSKDVQNKLLSTHGNRIFGILESIITGSWLSQNIWYGAADKAISTIYALHPTPDTFCVELLIKSLGSVFCSSEANTSQNCDTKSANVYSESHVAKLGRHLFVVSHVAINQLVYIESHVRMIRKEKSRKEKTDADGQSSYKNSTPNDGATKVGGINAELGLAVSDDAVLDSLSEKAEKEIVCFDSETKTLIGHTAPFLSMLCRDFGLMQKYPWLQVPAMHALCNLMIIDADFCNSNLRLLFTVVESSPLETVRSNCTISLGDLAVRFPNLLEPWTENMYYRLRDRSVSVRKNGVLVLSHLILNDMMKVKGYINEMAVCIEDIDGRISNLAKLFFNELSKKGSNPIYNLLPDILGKLCNQNLKSESFCNIMQFLIASIKKDKQMEALVEKLCNRFIGVTDVRQWRCISYSISQLAFTEKGMRKFIESFKTYEHVLCDESVMSHFKNIIGKGKKFGKTELKSCIEEFEEKLEKTHLEMKEQEATARNAQLHQHKIGNLDAALSSDGSFPDGEVTNLCAEQTKGVLHSVKSEKCEFEEQSSASSDLTEAESGDHDVQCPQHKSKDGEVVNTDSCAEQTKGEEQSSASNDLTKEESGDHEVQSPQHNSKEIDGEVDTDSCVQEQTNGALRLVKSEKCEMEEQLSASSELTMAESGDQEVQCQQHKSKGASKSRIRKTKNNQTSASARTTRSKRGVY